MKKLTFILCACLFSVMISGQGMAQSGDMDGTPFIGKWKFQVTGTPAGTINMVVTVEQAENELVATIGDPTMGFEMDLESIVIEDSTLSATAGMEEMPEMTFPIQLTRRDETTMSVVMNGDSFEATRDEEE